MTKDVLIPFHSDWNGSAYISEQFLIQFSQTWFNACEGNYTQQAYTQTRLSLQSRLERWENTVNELSSIKTERRAKTKLWIKKGLKVDLKL